MPFETHAAEEELFLPTPAIPPLSWKSSNPNPPSSLNHSREKERKGGKFRNKQLLEILRFKQHFLPSPWTFISWNWNFPHTKETRKTLLPLRFFIFICIHIGMNTRQVFRSPSILILYFPNQSFFFLPSMTRACREREVHNRRWLCVCGSRNQKLQYCQYCRFRIFPFAIRALSRLDLFRRSILYGKHNASMHHFHRPILVAAIPDEIRP